MRRATRYRTTQGILELGESCASPGLSDGAIGALTTAQVLIAALAAALSVTATPAVAQDTSDLAKQAQNPVATLISVPFQNNFNFDVGPREKMQDVLNIQPVIPFRVSNGWNVITRAIAPLIHQPELGPGIGNVSGLGDIQFSAFLSPVKPRRVLWGVGPIVSLPTATDDLLGTEKLGIGPTGVTLATHGPWLVGTLVNNVFSVAGASDLFGNSADEYLKVNHRGASNADVTEGSGGIWERLYYDWSDRNRVVMKTTDSNVWGRRSGHIYTFAARPDGTTDVDAVVVREGKNLKGRALGLVLGIVGKRVLDNAFRNTIKAIEGNGTPGAAAVK